jgi:hypothetical protein
MKLSTLEAFFGEIRDLAVWDIAINHECLARHQWPDSMIVDHALYLYLFQQQRIRGSMNRDPRLPDIDLRDFAYYGMDHGKTCWFHPSFGYIVLSFSGLDEAPRLLLYSRTHTL